MSEELTDDPAKGFSDFAWRSQVPNEALFKSAFQFSGDVFIEGVGSRHQDGLTHVIERQDTPALQRSGGAGADQLDIKIISIEWEIGEALFIRDRSERFFNREDVFIREHLDEGLDDPGWGL